MADQQQESNFERHGQTVLQLVVAGLVAWFGLQVVEQGRSVVRVEVTVEALSAQMSGIQKAMMSSTGDHYRRSDAATDLKVVHERIHTVEGRVERLEVRP